MLGVSSRLASITRSGIRPQFKLPKRPSKCNIASSPPLGPSPRFVCFNRFKALYHIPIRWIHVTREEVGAGESVESFLEQTTLLASQLTPELKKSREAYLNNLENQVKLMDSALNLAVKQNRGDKVAIFVNLIKTCDVHQLWSDLVEVVEKHSELLDLEEVAREGVPGLYAEALLEMGRVGDSLKAASSASDRLFQLQNIPTDTLAIALFNLATIQQNCSLIDDAIRSYKRAIALTKPSSRPSPKSSFIGVSSLPTDSSSLENRQTNSVKENAPYDLNSVSPHLAAMLHAKVAGLLLAENRKTEAVPHLKAAVDIREVLLKQNPQDESLRNLYVRSIEALSGTHLEMHRSDASRLVWERASLVLEYGGDSTEFIAKEIEQVEQALQQPMTSNAQLAAVKHRHGKALIACNTRDSLENSIQPLRMACDTYREIKDQVALIDALEDLSNAYEALAYASTSTHASKEVQPTAFLDEQIATFGECLTISESLNGPMHTENARYLTNLAIFTAARGEKSRAKDLVRAALYICDKAELGPEEEIVARAQTVRVFLTEESESTYGTNDESKTSLSKKLGSKNRNKTNGKSSKM